MASTRFSRLLKILATAVTDADEIFQLEGRLERFVHFWALVTRQFIRYRCFVRASALSFSTLLALIPLLAVALSVTGSLLTPLQEAKLTRFVEKSVASLAPPANIPATMASAEPAAPAPTNSFFPPTTNAGPGAEFAVLLADTNAPDSAAAGSVNPQDQVAREIHGLVRNASNGTIGSVGFVFLILTAISLLRGIEETFNDMWGVTRGRNWWLQFMLYWFIITLGPLLLSITLGLAGGAYWQHTRSWLQASPWLAPVYDHVLPILLLSFMLGCFYKLTPNTKVEFSAAMVGGLCAGAAWHGYNQLGFVLVSRALNASKYYGGLALVVLVMGGLYVLWLILLFGAEIAYAYQNRTAYLQDRLAENVNQRGREFVALRIMTCLGRRFQNGLRPATVPEISAELGVPSRLTQSVLRTLAAMRLVAEAAGMEAAFLPARPLEAINAHDILLAMRTGTGQELPVPELAEFAEIYGEFTRIEQAERVAASKVTLFSLANRTSPRLLGEETAEPALTVPVSEAFPIAPPSNSVVSDAPAPTASPPRESAPVKPTPARQDADKTSTPAPAEAAEPPRREAARPSDHPDFPL